MSVDNINVLCHLPKIACILLGCFFQCPNSEHGLQTASICVLYFL